MTATSIVTLRSSAPSSEKRLTFFSTLAGEARLVTSIPEAVWNLRTTERRASSGGIRNSSS